MTTVLFMGSVTMGTDWRKVIFSVCEKGGKGLSGLACRVDYGGVVEDGIVEGIDMAKHRAIVYL